MNGKTYRVETPAAWKDAIKAHLNDHRTSRYAFIRRLLDEGVCSVHTGECLLADHGTVTGDRTPNLAMAMRMARIAGFDIMLVARNAPATRQVALTNEPTEETV